MPSGIIVQSGVNAVVKPRPFDPAVEKLSVYIGMRHPDPEESLDTYVQYQAQLLKSTLGLANAAIVLAAENTPGSVTTNSLPG